MIWRMGVRLRSRIAGGAAAAARSRPRPGRRLGSPWRADAEEHTAAGGGLGPLDGTQPVGTDAEAVDESMPASVHLGLEVPQVRGDRRQRIPNRGAIAI